jgi:transcription initiation factor TFIIB
MGKFIKKCPECSSINLQMDDKRGEIVCRSCGLVLDENIIDMGQEWRGGPGDQGEARGGAPTSFTKHDKGMGTMMGTKAEIYSLPTDMRRKVMRMQKWHTRSSTALERNLKYALVELRRMASILNVPSSVEEEAARLYNLAVRKNLVRGRSMESVVVATLYIAARRYGLPRSLNEICRKVNISKRELGKTYRFITRELVVKLLPSTPRDYIPKFASELSFSADTQTRAIEILEDAEKKQLTSGRGPTGLAAAALYVASLMTGEKRTQREIANVVGVTEVTIRNRYKEIVSELDIKDIDEFSEE